MTGSTQIMIVEDHVLVRQALKKVLEAEGSVRVAADMSSWQEAVSRQEQAPCDMVLMDISLEGESGLEGIEQMRTRWPDLPILAISGHLDQETVIAALRAGASGYIAKSAPYEELIAALLVLRQGRGYIDPQLTRMVISQFRRTAATADATPTAALTARERQIMELVARGKSNRDISDVLFITETTVKSYLRSLYRRLGVADRAHAVAYVMRTGLIPMPSADS